MAFAMASWAVACGSDSTDNAAPDAGTVTGVATTSSSTNAVASSTTTSSSGGAGGAVGSTGTAGSAGASSGGGGSAGATIDVAVPSDAPSDALIVASTGPWTVYADPYANGMPNPAMGIMGQAVATQTPSNGMHLELTVSGLPPNRTFGSHLHLLACDDTKAGGHYQNMPAPDGGANDPTYANPTNEAWLDITTDASGMAHAVSNVSWYPRPGGAKAIIVHDHGTTDGGVAGAKLACLSMVF